MNIKSLLVFLTLFVSINLSLVLPVNAKYRSIGRVVGKSYHHGNNTGDYRPFWFLLFVTFVGGAVASANDN